MGEATAVLDVQTDLDTNNSVITGLDESEKTPAKRHLPIGSSQIVAALRTHQHEAAGCGVASE